MNFGATYLEKPVWVEDNEITLSRLSVSYQWEISHGLLIYGPGGLERALSWRMNGEQ